MRKALMLATTLAIFAGPALAADKSPQTNATTPDPAAAGQMNTGTQSQPQNAQVPSTTSGATSGQQAAPGSDTTNSMNPNMNPRGDKKPK